MSQSFHVNCSSLRVVANRSLVARVFPQGSVNQCARLAWLGFVFVNRSAKPIEPVCECSRRVTESSNWHRNVACTADRRELYRLRGDIEPGKCVTIDCDVQFTFPI
jgi:hypothetical protein